MHGALRPRALRFVSTACALAALSLSGDFRPSASAAGAASGRLEDKKPKLTLKASPVVAFSPARVVVTGELKGGPDDYEEYYCASVEWDWGDDTVSENTYDCNPYEAGKSELRRRFVGEHVYRTAGSYSIQFSLKKKNKTVTASRTSVQIKAGARDIGQ
jgi:hypothetical protein